MYFIDFVKTIVQKKNIGLAIWLILNTAICVFLFGAMFDVGVRGYIFGGILYFAILAISISPIGEAILRFQNGCKRIKRQEYLNRLMPLFEEVYAKAKRNNPELPDGIKIYMAEDPSENAFATGRRTICVTKGLLKCSDNQIKSILAHEFGHLAHKDTDAILMVSVGNMIVTAAFVIFRVIVNFVTCVVGFGVSLASKSVAGVITTALSRFLIDFVLVMAMSLWTKLGVLLCMASSRKNEKLADEYSYKLGYGDFLCSFLDKIGGAKATGLFAALYSSHPDKDARIAYLQELGCKYYNNVGR